MPEYAVIEAEENGWIPISSGAPLNLEPGKYALILYMIGVPAPGQAARPGYVDLRLGIQQLVRRQPPLANELTLPQESVRFIAAGYFSVDAGDRTD